ncbi:MAG: ribosome biogenesis GTPase YlqF [Clostridiales Family XIII bacterium]|jgi:ribosome biogenesis GTPase A|nr:ribosome biogenesis GTPase YlqF [Clostridiales Family XIII bacterium]
MIENINWYPGHMKKTRELIAASLRLVGAVIEVCDARIPVSSRNPIIDELTRGKPRVLILNKLDLADEQATKAWICDIPHSENSSHNNNSNNSHNNNNNSSSSGNSHNNNNNNSSSGNSHNNNNNNSSSGNSHNNNSNNSHNNSHNNNSNHRDDNNHATIAIAMNSVTGQGIKKLIAALDCIAAARQGNAASAPLRVMIVGVPNSGKSSLINRLTGRKAAQTGDRPGITRGKQWLTLENGMQLLDTPGILWPKFEDPQVGLNLAFCGSIKDEIMDVPDLSLELIRTLEARYPGALAARFDLGGNGIAISSEPGSDEQAAPGETSAKAVPAEDRGIAAPESESEIIPALAIMEAIALKRGCILPGKRIDYERAGRMILDEFRAGKLGRITIERV